MCWTFLWLQDIIFWNRMFSVELCVLWWFMNFLTGQTSNNIFVPLCLKYLLAACTRVVTPGPHYLTYYFILVWTATIHFIFIIIYTYIYVDTQHLHRHTSLTLASSCTYLTFLQVYDKMIAPIKITVAAWQYGRAVEPKIQTAPPVFQSFNIIK